MRIGLVVPGFSASEADWCIPALLDLVRVLAADHELRIISLRYPGESRSYQVYGAEVTALGAGQKRGIGRLTMLARARSAILRDSREAPFDVLHALWAHEPGFIATLLAARLAIPTVVSLLGGELAALPEIGYGGAVSPVNRRLIRFALARATRVTVGSQSLKRVAAEHVAAERLRILPLGVDTNLFHRGPTSPSGPLSTGFTNILNVASHVPVKDLATLLRAFAAACEERSDLRLHLVGDGASRPDLEAAARDLGISSRVTFHGAVSHECLPDYYRAADLCVLSSLFESQGMVTLEAAACGRMTAGTETGLLPELVPSAWTVAPGEAQGLAAVILAALEDRSRLAAEGEALRRRVAESYALEVTARRLVLLYEQAMAESRAAGRKDPEL